MTYGFSIDVENKTAIQSMRQIEEQLASMGIKAKVEAKKVESSFTEMGGKVKNVLSEIKGALGLIGVGFAVFKGGEFLHESIEKFHELEKATAQVRAGLESTKGAAGMTFKDVQESAKGLAAQLPYSRKELLDMQSILLTFPSVTKESFTPASEIIADMSTRLGQDLKSSAIQVGKALQDPEKGVTALRRVGVNFNKEQTEMIQRMVESGHTAQAQAAIMKELKTEFEGSARAAAEVDPLFQFNKSMGAFSTNIGEATSILLENLKPALDSVGEGFVTVGENVKDFFNSFNGGDSKTSVLKEIYAEIVDIIRVLMDVADTFFMVADAIGSAFYAIKGTVTKLNPFTKDNGSEDFKNMSRSWQDMKDEAVGKAGKEFAEKAMGSYEKNEKRDDLFKQISETQHKFQDGELKQADYLKEVTKLKSSLNKEFKGANGLIPMSDYSEYSSKWAQLTKPLTAFGKPAGNGGTGLKDAALNTSTLSGASGGLGSAKIINMKVDAIQKNYGVISKDVRQKSQEGADVLVRALNNISESQGQTQ